MKSWGICCCARLGAEIFDFLFCLGKDGRKLGFFFRSEFAKDKISVTEFFAKLIVPCAEAEAREIFCV